ncbi:hypothetical protein BDV98DRAFT_658712 [Pterulicium gracile]|uniref:F-box domain-containing protein n=1 Tax=Pterulicium gracile TaxID=1884261 RepID=A0A5C3Q587_9AGAR|nr:hypothetical protein BDV98DRAFT_658712 [Pterula gracilis]
MQVCKHWRSICLENGSLWSEIIIDTAIFYVHERPLLELQQQQLRYNRPDERLAASLTAHSARLLDAQLRRSKTADLKVTFRIEPVDHEYGQLYLRILFHISIESRRLSIPWQELPSAEEAARMKQLLARSNLQNFQITLHPPRRIRLALRTVPLALTFYQSMALTSLKLVGVPDCWDRLHPLLPQLRSRVQIHLVDGMDQDVEQAAPEHLPLNRIALPRLQELSVAEELASGRVYQLFDHILIQVANSLAISLVEGFLIASGSMLEFLEWQLADIHPITEFLKGGVSSLIHSVRWLHLGIILEHMFNGDPEASDLTKDSTKLHDEGIIPILKLLSETDGQGGMTLFPQLRSLQIEGAIVPVEKCIDMLQSRRSTELSARLASCTLTSALAPYCQLSRLDLEETAMQTARLNA